LETRRILIALLLFLSACTTASDLTLEAARANTHKTLTALAKTPTSTATLVDTQTPTETEFSTVTREIPTFTETATWTPTNTETPLPSITPTASPETSPTSSDTPPPIPTVEFTPTAEVFVTTEAQLRQCTSQLNAICQIGNTIALTSQLIMQTSGVTLRGGAITNAPEYPDRLVMVARTTDVRLENMTIYGTVASVGSVVKDCLLILDSNRITLDHVTLLYCEDENLDVTGSTNVDITNSVVMQPLHCAMHTKGCHGYAMLIVNSTATIRDSVIGSAKARMPELQNSHVTMERVLLDNLDGSAIQVMCDAVLTTQGVIIRGDFDTDDISYGITTPHAEDCVPAGKATPLITEKCTLVTNWHVALNGDKYPRVRRSSTYYTNPTTTTEFKSDSSGCVMPTGDNDDTTDDDMTRIIQNAGSQGTPACLPEANCQIIDAPPS